MADTSANGGRVGGLFGSLKNFGAGLVGLAQTRLRLLANEVQAEKLRTGRLLLLALSAFFFLALAILMLTLLVVAAFWDGGYRLVAIGVFAAAYGAAGIALFLCARRHAATPSNLFEASLSELAKDHDQLTS